MTMKFRGFTLPVVAAALLGLTSLPGCGGGGGIEVGSPTKVVEGDTNPPGFAEMQKSIGDDMMKGAKSPRPR